jgi:hypothetical protein
MESTLLDLDDGKGLGPDGVPPLVLKSCVCDFAVIFNRFLNTFVFPDAWKLSFVTPILKSGRRNDVVHYRGIPVL